MRDHSAEKPAGDSPLHGLLEKKLTIYHRYFHLTKKIKNAFESGEREQLRSMVSERKNVIKKADRIDAALWRLSDKGVLPFANIIEKSGSQMQKLRQIVEAVDVIDSELLAMATSETEELKKALLKLRRIRKASRGYGSHLPPSSKFISIRN